MSLIQTTRVWHVQLTENSRIPAPTMDGLASHFTGNWHSLCHRRVWPASRGVSGFTIMELLLTMTIISLLVSMLLPVIAMVRESAHSVACLAVLRQMGMANQAYANDSHGFFVPAMYFDGAGNPNWTTDQWYQNEHFLSFLVDDEAQKHASSRSLWRGLICPTIRAKNRLNLTLATYGINARSLRGGWAPNTISVAREGYHNGQVYMFGDGLDWLLYTSMTYDESYEGVFQSGGMVAYRHRGRHMNAVMYDGSARPFGQTDMSNTYALPWMQ